MERAPQSYLSQVDTRQILILARSAEATAADRDAAVTELYRRLEARVARLALRAVVERLGQTAGEEVPDLVGQVFVHLLTYERWTSPDAIPALDQGLLHTIVKNCLLTRLRYYELRTHASLDEPIAAEEDAPLLGELQPAASLLPEELVLQQDFYAAVTDAIDRLPTSQRVPVRLRLFEQVDYEHIAAHAGVNVVYARKMVSLGLKRLREELKGYGPCTA